MKSANVKEVGQYFHRAFDLIIHSDVSNFVFREFCHWRFSLFNRSIISNYLNTHEVRKLQVGSGLNRLDGWLNTDIFAKKGIAFLDARKRFPFNDWTFDYVFCEHLIEHLEYRLGVGFIRECFRVLKPGGKIRISTPDLRFLIELYNENKTDVQTSYIRNAVDTFLPEIGIYQDTFVINNFFKGWGHKFIYDFKTLNDLLVKSGFVNVTRQEPGQSADQNLVGIESHGIAISEEFNSLESIVLEGTKAWIEEFSS
jgi:predicted SAM-dependent methyltransferase